MYTSHGLGVDQLLEAQSVIGCSQTSIQIAGTHTIATYVSDNTVLNKQSGYVRLGGHIRLALTSYTNLFWIQVFHLKTQKAICV